MSCLVRPCTKDGREQLPKQVTQWTLRGRKKQGRSGRIWREEINTEFRRKRTRRNQLLDINSRRLEIWRCQMTFWTPSHIRIKNMLLYESYNYDCYTSCPTVVSANHYSMAVFCSQSCVSVAATWSSCLRGLCRISARGCLFLPPSLNTDITTV